jgi:hypothetical protein
MLKNFFTKIYINLFVLQEKFAIGLEMEKSTGPSTLFCLSTFFWLQNIYITILTQFTDLNPQTNTIYVYVLGGISLLLTLFLIFITKAKNFSAICKISFLNQKASLYFTIFYIVFPFFWSIFIILDDHST